MPLLGVVLSMLWLLLQREALLGTAVVSNLLQLLQSPQKLRQAAAVEALAALLAGNQALAARVMQLHDLRDSLLPLLRGADVRTRFLACSCLVSISSPAAQVEEAGQDAWQQEAQASETMQVGGADQAEDAARQIEVKHRGMWLAAKRQRPMQMGCKMGAGAACGCRSSSVKQVHTGSALHVSVSTERRRPPSELSRWFEVPAPKIDGGQQAAQAS